MPSRGRGRAPRPAPAGRAARPAGTPPRPRGRAGPRTRVRTAPPAASSTPAGSSPAAGRARQQASRSGPRPAPAGWGSRRPGRPRGRGGHRDDPEPAVTGDRHGPGGGERPVERGRVDRGANPAGAGRPPGRRGGPRWCRRCGTGPRWGADQVAGGTVALGAGDPAQEGRRDPGRLALDQVGGGGHLVGHRDLGDLEQPAVAVGPAPPVVKGAHAGQPHGHVGLPEPPGPAEGVGDDHGHVVAVQLLDRGPQPGRRGVGVGGQQHQPVPAGVGRVDQGVGPDQAGAGLGDDQPAPPGHHPDGLGRDRGGQDPLAGRRVLGQGDRAGPRPWPPPWR